ncbi:plasmid maintenance protein [Borrelia hermsii]|uniref:Uncharacterized protein n=2 Tax=Borrelia hermsii TaxID=140 RepID=A0AAN0X6P0_BORHE|nr:plasmid maintenance protein [Borrelia hermsii]AMR76174.1 hypothetical protein A0V01_06185 [Borrelia hermsii]ANA43899.1 ORF-A-type plasmid protein [Borrelia hermsii HS1]
MEILEKAHNKEPRKKFNKHQHKLIVLISTLNYMNLTLRKYTQSNILYYFNNNLKRNGQKIIKIKTLQSYLYKLEKELQVTINYYKHLGKNYGTEIYYQLRYPKNKCYHKINSYFKRKREKKFNERVYKYLCSKNINEEKWECINNINNINNIKPHEKKEVIKNKQKELKLKQKTPNHKNKKFKKESHNKNKLKEKLNKTYKNHNYKPNSTAVNKKSKNPNTITKATKEKESNENNIRNNIFSILLEQLKQKTEVKVLVPLLKNYLDNTNNLNYTKIINNHYYYELLEILNEV